MDTTQVLVIDCDGVLTNGKLTIDHHGEKMFKQFHTRDVRAIRELIANGVEVYIVSADGWGGTQHFADKVGAVFFELRDKSDLLQKIGCRTYWAVGDDAWDIAMMKKAVRCFCPNDADYSVFGIEPGCNLHVLNRKGGEGCIAELAYLILENRLEEK